MLAEACGGDVVRVDRSNDMAAVDALIALEAAGYKGRTGISLTSVPGEPEYFREMCAGFAELGRLTVLALQAGGTTAAIDLLIAGGDGLFGITISHDESLSKFGPGILLHLETFEYFDRETTATFVDTCTYEGNQTLLGLYPDRRRIVSYLIGLGSPVGNQVVRALPHLRAAHRSLAARRWSAAPEPPGRSASI